ncbi:MAG: phosphoribosylformylglycinamidine synthase subunit PurL [Acidobacteriota bacterium]
MQIHPDLIDSHGLTRKEYQRIRRILGREPNLTELGIFSVMWSEHCSYKSSRLHLKKLPTEGPRIIEGPGENAGVVDIGEGLAAVFKIESHNHPSFIEPYQGAATGVGGIIRDIFTMGARPIALMNSLHFGLLHEPLNQVIMEGVVAGIAGYGNCMGVPTVGGEIYFQACYAHNPIVNVFCLGVAPVDRIFRAKASGVGNPVIYVGARTGRDGIHGATMASEQFDEGSPSKRPNVQVGDPFLEKLLLEACLEVMQTGAVVGIQDMGAAGLTCSTTEMAGHSGTGIQIDLERVPKREQNMTPYEIMLSESQERMLLVVEKGREEEVLRVFHKWDLDAVVIGEVREHGNLVVCQGHSTVAEIPNQALVQEAPCYDRPSRQPSGPGERQSWKNLDLASPADFNATLLQLLSSPHLCSRQWVYSQYDHQVQTNTVVAPGGDAAVLRLKTGRGALAVTLDGNPRFCRLDPSMGAKAAVAEACRNLVCVGAQPLAATNCLNFASPENPEVMWQFIRVVEGMGEACRCFGTPITGGNVSFYNETSGVGIFPTPVVGMVGRIDDLDQKCDSHFQRAGDQIYLLGETLAEMGGGIYLEVLDMPLVGPCPRVDLEREKRLHSGLLRAIHRGLVQSAHDLSEGGLAVALAEACLAHHCGLRVEVETSLRPDYFLWSETPSRVVVSVKPEQREAFLEAVFGLPVTRLGQVAEDQFQVTVNNVALISMPVDQISQAWQGSLQEVLAH